MSRKKRNMFGGVYTCIQCLYHIRGRKNNKVNYCSDEKERKIRGKGPPWHTLIIHNVLNMSCYITTSLPLLPHHLAHLFSELYQFTYGLIQTQQRPTSLIVIVTSSSNKFLRHVKVISRYEKDFREENERRREKRRFIIREKWEKYLKDSIEIYNNSERYNCQNFYTITEYTRTHIE